MKCILEKTMKNDSYISVYINASDTTEFEFGKIFSVNDSSFAMCSFAPNGKTDGFIAALNKNIIKTEMDSRYAKKMEKLISLNKEKYTECVISGRDPICEILAYSLNNKKIITIQYEENNHHDDKIKGIITEVDHECCRIKITGALSRNGETRQVWIKDIFFAATNNTRWL